jgi:hypothetical protein
MLRVRFLPSHPDTVLLNNKYSSEHKTKIEKGRKTVCGWVEGLVEVWG